MWHCVLKRDVCVQRASKGRERGHCGNIWQPLFKTLWDTVELCVLQKNYCCVLPTVHEAFLSCCRCSCFWPYGPYRNITLEVFHINIPDESRTCHKTLLVRFLNPKDKDTYNYWLVYFSLNDAQATVVSHRKEVARCSSPPNYSTQMQESASEVRWNAAMWSRCTLRSLHSFHTWMRREPEGELFPRRQKFWIFGMHPTNFWLRIQNFVKCWIRLDTHHLFLREYRRLWRASPQKRFWIHPQK